MGSLSIALPAVRESNPYRTPLFCTVRGFEDRRTKHLDRTHILAIVIVDRCLTSGLLMPTSHLFVDKKFIDMETLRSESICLASDVW